MSIDAYRRAAARAADVLEQHGVPWGVARFLCADVLTPLAGGLEVDLVATIADRVRERVRTLPRQSMPQLSHEQIERAAVSATAVVEGVLAELLAVRADAEDPVWGEDETAGDPVRRLGVVGHAHRVRRR